MCEIDEYDYVYLATEDLDIFNVFQEHFRGRLLYVPQRRIPKSDFSEGKRVLAELIDESEMEKHLVDYMLTIYVLSQCTSLLASGICGGVSAAIDMNEGKYEDVYIYDLGEYE